MHDSKVTFVRIATFGQLTEQIFEQQMRRCCDQRRAGGGSTLGYNREPALEGQSDLSV